MLQLEEACARILDAVQPLEAQCLPTPECAGRFLRADVVAAVDLPSFDNSAMDGFAVRAAETSGASMERPIRLRVAGEVAAGSAFEEPLPAACCVRIFTGSPIPAGADAVVMQEDTRSGGADVEVLEAAKPWENVRLRGEDVAGGATVLRAGVPLTAPRLALAAAAGIGRLTVTRRPTVGLLSTGSELCESDQPLGPGKIYESNRVALAELVRAVGGIARVYPLIPDSLESTIVALKTAFKECDAVVTTGGVSVGSHDYVKAAFEAVGGTIDFWKVSIRPGKPFVWGRVDHGHLFGLPGNPVSAFVTFLLLVRPALLRLQGAASVHLPTLPATAAEDFHNTGSRRHFVRIIVDPTGEVRSTGTQSSHMLSSLADANGLLDLAPGEFVRAGSRVQVLRWGI